MTVTITEEGVRKRHNKSEYTTTMKKRFFNPES